ncbi:MAG: hypothetical protein GY797_36290 [Deltaproteobacteria bacterium]|nr:hypothetical protein [Deltaproteobacteria bacterium]
MIDVGAILQDVFSDDNDLVIYRPALRSIAKSIASTILLSQILYWDKDAKNKGKTEFWKFKTPPNSPNPKYKEGDSWCEELNITPDEFDGALKNIGSKYSKKVPKDPEAFVWYRTDMTRCTYYEVNAVRLRKAIMSIYDESTEEGYDSRKSGIPVYVNRIGPVSIYTENTTENTIKDISKEIYAPQAEHNSDDQPLDYNGLLCPVCKEPQFTCRSGDTCSNGHGGEIGIEKEKPKLKKLLIKKKTPNLFNYTPNALKILTHWEKRGGKVHKKKTSGNGLDKIKDMIDIELMQEDTLNSCYSKYTGDSDLKKKKWTVKEIIRCIDHYTRTLNKDTSKMYFSNFVEMNYYGNAARNLRNHSPLLDCYRKLPNEEVLKWQKRLRSKFFELYPKVDINATTLLNCSIYLVELDKDYQVINSGVLGNHIVNLYVAHMRRLVTDKGTHEPLKYMSGQDNLDTFFKSTTKSLKLKKRSKVA